ncbi:unnamed protein product [Bemisia tabaci]|uniref:Uncharacterized protein n=1 Tax=Bemisia tabaci TaxID=7038 RepID=A0A9P0AB42_BEMTA|nr:unnamed protein product [Bemisia tabaci]
MSMRLMTSLLATLVVVGVGAQQGARGWFSPRRTVTKVLELRSLVVTSTPSSCVAVQTSLPPCRHIRQLNLSPTRPTRNPSKTSLMPELRKKVELEPGGNAGGILGASKRDTFMPASLHSFPLPLPAPSRPLPPPPAPSSPQSSLRHEDLEPRRVVPQTSFNIITPARPLLHSITPRPPRPRIISSCTPRFEFPPQVGEWVPGRTSPSHTYISPRTHRYCYVRETRHGLLDL